MNLREKSSVEIRRIFLKKSLYSAPVLLALGHLSPSMVYGADSGFSTPTDPTPPTDPVTPTGTQAATQTNYYGGGAGGGGGGGTSSGYTGGNGQRTGGGSGSGATPSGDVTVNTDQNLTGQ